MKFILNRDIDIWIVGCRQTYGRGCIGEANRRVVIEILRVIKIAPDLFFNVDLISGIGFA